MELNRKSLKRAVAAWSKPFGGLVWGAALGLLGLVLAVQAWRSYGEVRELSRRQAHLERRVERIKGENRALQEELKALETDPLYVESVLRGRKMVRAGERLVK